VMITATALPACRVQSREQSSRVLTRVAYGPEAWTKSRLAVLGPADFIEEQLHPETIDDGDVEALIDAYPTQSMDLGDLDANYNWYGMMGSWWDILRQTQKAKVLRAVYSHRQLEAILTDFWFNHFNVDAGMQTARFDIVPYVRDVIRPNVLGSFEDLLVAVAKSPAMLDFLDNAVSTADGFAYHGETLGLNENYARELMELHTLGVDGPYDEDDVIEVARAFSGWTIDPLLSAPGGFRFHERAHDYGEKVVFGGDLILPEGWGVEDGEEVLAYLAHHPKTADHLCRKLIARFVNEDVPEGLAEDCVATWTATGGDLREVMREILFSNAFLLDEERNKVKRPLFFAASLIRAMDVESLTDDQLGDVVSQIGALGEDLYRAAPPTGYPESSAFWSASNGMLGRINLVHRWTRSWARLDAQWSVACGESEHLVDEHLAHLISGPVSEENRADLIAFVDTLYQRNEETRVGEAASMVLMSPEFMVH
ncbi:MAG: DUF1800 domain-containing protein, partial [Myxococcales bacterium]|nr:DUF1800 domain-containing protein [Myxococcales bacterium]